MNTTSVVDTAYFANSARLVSRTAALLNKQTEAQKYEKLANDITAAFNQAYVQEDGTIRAGTQTTYILALRFANMLFELRGAVSPGDQPGAVPAGYDRLVAPYRMRRL